jgi:hypothetical protein
MPLSAAVQEWLLAPAQPAVRFLTLTEILGRSPSDPQVKEARRTIPTTGWAADILAERGERGTWGDPKSLYVPKYHSTNWMLLVLSDLGLTREHAPIRASCDLWMDTFARPDGGFGNPGGKSSHVCVTANTARALVKFGFEDDRRVRSAFDWLVEDADPKGGWSCYGSGRLLDTWEPLSAFASLPRARWTASARSCVERGAEFFLERELHRQGDRYEPWFRTHYPVHYYYDMLVGLDCLTALGYGSDPRLDFALAWLKELRRRDGRWNLGGVHPDVEGGMAEWYSAHPKQRPTPFQLEPVGQPSKMITFLAARVLSRVDRARARP